MNKRKVTAYRLRLMWENAKAQGEVPPKFRLVETVLGWVILVTISGEDCVVVDKLGATKYWTVEQAMTNCLFVTSGGRFDLALYPRAGISRD